jgi:hypothetical protein
MVDAKEEDAKKDLDFMKLKEKNKKFFQKTYYLMYVLISLSTVLAVFFYIISVGKVFVPAVMLLMAFMGVIIVRDTKKKQAELDDFALYYGFNKIKNEKTNGKEKV